MIICSFICCWFEWHMDIHLMKFTYDKEKNVLQNENVRLEFIKLCLTITNWSLNFCHEITQIFFLREMVWKHKKKNYPYFPRPGNDSNQIRYFSKLCRIPERIKLKYFSNSACWLLAHKLHAFRNSHPPRKTQTPQVLFTQCLLFFF